MKGVFPRFLCCLGLLVSAGAGAGLIAAEASSAIDVGTAKDAVIETLGPPPIQSRLGPREILRYPQGQVVLEADRVVRLEWRGETPPGTTSSAPAARTTAAAAAASGGWLSDYETAKREAGRRKVPLLVWFAGSDWSLASRQFRDEVALQAGFVGAFQSRYVLLRVDLPDHNEPLQAGNAQLRDRVGVTVYPTLLILSLTGDNLAKIDLSRAAAGEAYADQVIAAVREMHDLLGFAPLPALPRNATPLPAATAHRPVRTVTPGQLAAGLLSAGWQAVTAVGTGLLVAGFLFWLVWRKGGGSSAVLPRTDTAERIAEAASGIPTLPDIMAWPRERVVVVATGLAECEGFLTEPAESGADDCDLRLRRTAEPGVRGLVCCAGAKSGLVTTKRVRNLFGQMRVEGVTFGWFVAPSGFSTEARTFADAHGIRLSDGPGLLAQLHELPPVALPRVTREPWAQV